MENALLHTECIVFIRYTRNTLQICVCVCVCERNGLNYIPVYIEQTTNNIKK